MNERIHIEVDETITLEGQWDIPDQPVMVAVFCHPHPLQRGTMEAPLMKAVTTHLVDAGIAVLRFNFRGVGESTGEHNGGIGEVDDIDAAVDTAAGRFDALPLTIAGWSFGAVTSLRWHAHSGATMPWVGIAPPVLSDRTPILPEPQALAPAARHFIVGDRDQFVTVEDLTAYADSIGATLTELKGSDHFFYFREERVAAAVLTGFGLG